MYMQSNQILNSEDHANFLRKNEKNPADYRPDIIHQALLSILDSPVNKAGRLQSVYVRTEKGVLFEVKPHVRIPSTYKRFAGIMLHLLQKLSITAVSKGEKLLHVIKNPVTQYLPLNSQRIGLSYGSEKLVKMKDYVKAIDDDTYLVFVVGAMAHGKIGTDCTDDFVASIISAAQQLRLYNLDICLILFSLNLLAVSGYPLSAACCIARICEAVEDKWNIL
ncbi:hypothetical protein SLEP1_g49186 [Rubroshorea leprosula]|uniref:Ribosomal RNA small subunit methyltransferase NEP1 n=1 Tax=Rubroshorea leprosula TaxID=152421 RepID=A0AAV5LX02_9ROSI|nr:hypothetical protein SLEP1_g49186 [Rubroshorea leprosula]